MADQTVKTYCACGTRVRIDRVETPVPNVANEVAITFTLNIDGVVKPLSSPEVRNLIEGLDRALQGR